MKITFGNDGSVMLMAVFAIALLSVLVMGMLQMNTEEIQLMQNHIWAAQALAIAEAGLNDTFARIRFVARVEADITVETSDSSDHTIRIDNLRINE